MRDLNTCSALLFDGSHAEAMSRLFTEAHRLWHIAAPEVAGLDEARSQLFQALSEINVAAQTGAHIVLSMSYEASQSFSVGEHLPKRLKPQAHPDMTSTPWLQALAFDVPQLLNREQALTWLEGQSNHAIVHLPTPETKISEVAFLANIGVIRDLIAAGDTYQVNYTFPFVGDLLAYSAGNPDAALAEFYHRLVHDLRIPYGAFLRLPHNSVLSFSPELFVELKGKSVTCRPMKGTAAVGENDNDTTRRAALLAADEKNRAENLMIVDLMRNDLSRLPQTSAVRVPKLFEVKRYGDVLQMTSTVRADLTAQPDLATLFEALFPCGSITGAPKRRTMEIIDGLEPYARGAYCGTIGYLTPTQAGEFNATFSVPIRTFELTPTPIPATVGTYRWPFQCNVGAGITYGSDAQDEWQESLLKARFFTRHAQSFELIETMYAEKTESGNFAIRHLAQHRQRMAVSALALNFCFDEVQFDNQVSQVLLKLNQTDSEQWRVRFGLQKNGDITCTHTRLETTVDLVKCAIYDVPVDSGNPFLRYKTSVRHLYNLALAEAKANGLFDYVFVNEKGEVTEGARTAIFIKLNGEWLTPPLTCGVLPSIAREALLADEGMNAREQAFKVDDIRHAEKIILCNALYTVSAELV